MARYQKSRVETVAASTSLRAAVLNPGERVNDLPGQALRIGDGTTTGGLMLHANTMVCPEDCGGRGDGTTDDSVALQAALDKIEDTGRQGVLFLRPGKRYKCNSGLTLNSARVSIHGFAALDFSDLPDGETAITVVGMTTEFGNGYGFNGAITGLVQIIGNGFEGTSVAVKFDSPVDLSNTHMRHEGVQITEFGTAWQFGARGYNQTFIECKAFRCGVIFDWLGTEVSDGDERQTVVGGTFYNSKTFLKHRRPAGGFYCFGASIDYVEKVVDIIDGKAQFYATHFESNVWEESPFEVRSAGGIGGDLYIHGGWMLCQQNNGGYKHAFYTGENANIEVVALRTNNMTAALPADALTPITWATGPGRFRMAHTEVAFEFAGIPPRQHSARSILADGNFAAATLGQDMIWRVTDINEIVDRYGEETPEGAGAANNLILTRQTVSGEPVLRAYKSFGASTSARFILACIDVRNGDRAMGGFQIKRDPTRAGSGTTAPYLFRPGWIKIDGYDQYGVPIITKSQQADVNLTVGNDWALVGSSIARSQIVAPTWATHFVLEITMDPAAECSFLFRKVWADRL